MKKIFYIALLFAFVACEDKYENRHIQRYSQPYYLTKDYPIFFDASEILVDIQVKSAINPDATFKIVANDKYFFAGEKMKGIHVYEKTGNYRANPLCFIECKYMKAFDVADNILYCNNFVDLLAIDVKNPLHAKILHRQKDYFNKYSNNSLNLPIHSIDNNVYYEIGQKRIVLEGITTETKPPPDFSEYDKLYPNYFAIVNEIPDSLLMRADKPSVGIANVEGKIFTLGFDGLTQCLYTSGGIENTRWEKFSYSNAYNYMQVYDLRYKDGIIYIYGKKEFMYLDYNKETKQYIINYSWHEKELPLDIVSQTNNYIILSEININGYAGMSAAFIEEIGETIYIYYYNIPAQEATSMININDIIITLGKQLITYRKPNSLYTPFTSVKQYSNISGTSMLRDDNILIVANKQGLSFYDISDLGNIKPMQ